MSTRVQLEDELAGLKQRVKDLERQLGDQAAEAEGQIDRFDPAGSILFRQFANAIPYIIWMTSPEGRTLFVNPAFEEIFGRPCGDLYKRPGCWLESVHAADADKVSSLVSERRETRSENQFRVVRPDGETRVIRDLSVPLRDDRNEISMYVAIAEDVTEQESARAKIQQQQSQLAHVMRLSTMGEMAAGIAHEINQPLSAVSNYTAASVNLLRRAEEPLLETIFEWLGRAGAEARRAGEIIRRMRTFVKRVEPQRTNCDLETLIREGVELAMATGFKLETRITLELADPASRVDCDVVQIQQILVNLIRNACEAMQEMPVAQREIVIRNSSNSRETTVSISDVAVGPPIGEKVFEAFHTTKKNGMGMGLAICRSIVEAHSGRLWLEPNDSRAGTRFSFSLPLAGQRE